MERGGMGWIKCSTVIGAHRHALLLFVSVAQ